MINLRLLGSALAILSVLSCSATTGGHAAAGRLDATALTGLTCTHFDWAPLEGISERAAILLSGTLNGSPVVFQLDSGADVSFLQGGLEAWPELTPIEGTPAGAPRWARADVTLGAISTPRMPIMLMSSQQRPTVSTEPIGSIGLPYFEGKVIALDFPHQQFCAGVALPIELERRASFVSVKVAGGKLMVPIEINGAAYQGFAYDTGSSIFDIGTDLDLWKALTGKTAPEQADQIFPISRLGATVNLNRARTTGSLRIAGVKRAHANVDVISSAPTMNADMGRQMGMTFQGVIGNALFLDRIVVVDMRREGAYRFGVTG